MAPGVADNSGTIAGRVTSLPSAQGHATRILWASVRLEPPQDEVFFWLLGDATQSLALHGNCNMDQKCPSTVAECKRLRDQWHVSAVQTSRQQPSPDGGFVRWNMPRCWYCSSVTMSAVLRIGPAGTRAVFMALSTSSSERAAIQEPITCSALPGVRVKWVDK